MIVPQGTDAGIDDLAASVPPPIDPMDHQGLVRSVAKWYRGRGLDFDDLVSEGQIGLLFACRKYSEGSHAGAAFSTYAVPWIKEYIRRAVVTNPRPMGIPIHVYNAMIGVRHGRLERESLSKFMRECVDAANRLTELEFCCDQEMLGECKGRDGDEGSSASGRSSRLDSEDLLAVQTYIAILPSRERAIVVDYYGLEGSRPISLEKIAARIGISYARTGILFHRAIRRMKVRFAGEKVGL